MVSRVYIRATGLLLVGNGLGKVLAFLCHLLLIRHLQQTGVGVFAYLFTTAMLTATVSEIGIRGFSLRELAKLHESPVEAARLVGRALAARVTVLIASSAVFLLFAFPAFKYEQSTVAVVLWLFLYAAVDSLAIMAKALLRSLDTFWPDALGGVLTRAATLSLLLLWIPPGTDDLHWVGPAFAIPALVELIGVVFLLTWKASGLWKSFHLKNAGEILKPALPFALISILSLLYYRTGMLALEWFTPGDARVPLSELNASTRIPEGVAFLPIAVSNALLPALVRRANDLDFARKSFDMLLRHVGSVAIGLAMLLILRPGDWMTLLFNEVYSDAALTFALISATIVTSFLQYIMANQLIALHEEKRVMRRYSTALGLNVVLTMLLVPQLGSVGVGVSILVAEFVGTLLDGRALHRLNIRVSGATLYLWLRVSVVVALSWFVTKNQSALLFGAVTLIGCAAAWLPVALRDSRMSKESQAA